MHLYNKSRSFVVTFLILTTCIVVAGSLLYNFMQFQSAVKEQIQIIEKDIAEVLEESEIILEYISDNIIDAMLISSNATEFEQALSYFKKSGYKTSFNWADIILLDSANTIIFPNNVTYEANLLLEPGYLDRASKDITRIHLGRIAIDKVSKKLVLPLAKGFAHESKFMGTIVASLVVDNLIAHLNNSDKNKLFSVKFYKDETTKLYGSLFDVSNLRLFVKILFNNPSVILAHQIDGLRDVVYISYRPNKIIKYLFLRSIPFIIGLIIIAIINLIILNKMKSKLVKPFLARISQFNEESGATNISYELLSLLEHDTNINSVEKILDLNKALTNKLNEYYSKYNHARLVAQNLTNNNLETFEEIYSKEAFMMNEVDKLKSILYPLHHGIDSKEVTLHFNHIIEDITSNMDRVSKHLDILRSKVLDDIIHDVNIYDLLNSHIEEFEREFAVKFELSNTFPPIYLVVFELMFKRAIISAIKLLLFLTLEREQPIKIIIAKDNISTPIPSAMITISQKIAKDHVPDFENQDLLYETKIAAVLNLGQVNYYKLEDEMVITLSFFNKIHNM